MSGSQVERHEVRFLLTLGSSYGSLSAFKDGPI